MINLKEKVFRRLKEFLRFRYRNLRNLLECSTNPLSEFEPATLGEILQIIAQLKPNMFVGYDDITAKILKRYKQQLRPINGLIGKHAI
jgi:hypothetical protein